MAKGIAHRDWALHRSDYSSDQEFTYAVQQEQQLNVHIMERLGVAIVAAPVRRRSDGGSWFTEAVVFKTATVPGVRDAEPDFSTMVEEIEDAEAALVEDADSLAHVE